VAAEVLPGQKRRKSSAAGSRGIVSGDGRVTGLMTPRPLAQAQVGIAMGTGRTWPWSAGVTW